MTASLRVRTSAVALFMLLGVGMTSPVHAQEVQVPLSPDSTVYTIDAELRQKLGLFPEVKGFQQASLYRLSADAYELVIEYREQGQTLRERRPLTPAEVDRLRQRVAQQLQATGTRVGIEQPGRTELLTWTTLLGLAEGGLIVGAIDPEDDSVIAGLPLLTGAVGFFAPLFATQNRPVTEASGTLTGYGGAQGYAHAVELAGLLDGDNADGQVVAGLAAVAGAAEATAGYALGAHQGWSPGMAEMIAYNGVYGNFFGLGMGFTIVGGDDDLEDRDAEARFVAGISLLGSLAGMYVGHRMGQTGTYTRGDARLYGLAGLEAAQLAGSILIVSDSDNTRTNAGLLTGFSLAGLGIGTALVKSRDFSTYESNIIVLGNYAGALLGAGIANLGNSSFETATAMQAIGSLIGFGITYSVFAGEAQRRASMSTAGIDLDVEVTPHVASASGADGRPLQRPGHIVPEVTLRCTF